MKIEMHIIPFNSSEVKSSQVNVCKLLMPSPFHCLLYIYLFSLNFLFVPFLIRRISISFTNGDSLNIYFLYFPRSFFYDDGKREQNLERTMCVHKRQVVVPMADSTIYSFLSRFSSLKYVPFYKYLIFFKCVL